MTAQMLPSIEKSVEELAYERKTLYDEKQKAEKRIKAIDLVLRPYLAPRRGSDNPGVAFNATHEWRMKDDSLGKRVYNPLRLIELLRRFGVHEADIATLFDDSECSVNEKVLEVVTRDEPHLKGQITRISKVKGFRTGSIYEGRRK